MQHGFIKYYVIIFNTALGILLNFNSFFYATVVFSRSSKKKCAISLRPAVFVFPTGRKRTDSGERMRAKFVGWQWTQHKAPCFSLQSRGGSWGGIWLLSPHPQSVRGGFRKKGTKTWDAEITATFKDPCVAVLRTDYYRGGYFSFTGEILLGEAGVRGEGIQTNVEWLFYTRSVG